MDYLFFHEKPYQDFLSFLIRRGVPYENAEDATGMTVSVPEALSTELTDQIDRYYEALLADQESQLEEPEEAGGKEMAAIKVQLSDGRTVFVPVAAELVDRLLSVVSEEELADLVRAIVASLQDEA